MRPSDYESKEKILPLTPRELAALIAALRYWRDEMSPHNADQPYFDGLEPDPLGPEELQMLLDRLLHAVGKSAV